MTDVGGRTTKQTYVTTYTTDVDPRTLPDFDARGVVTGEGWRQGSQPHAVGKPTHKRAVAANQAAPRQAPSHQHPHQQRRGPREHSPAYSASPASSVQGTEAEEEYDEDGHRLRKKYTTTTVTTITTTTILLPKMQEAYVFPSMTTHQMEQQGHPYPTIGNGSGYEEVQAQLSRQPQGRVHQIESGHTSANASPDRQRQLQSSHSEQQHRLVPSQPQYGPDGNGSQAWVFQQQTANAVSTEESRGRLPTLEELGITSYFAKDGVATQPQRAAPYAPASRRGNGASSSSPQQPWVAAETRHEVEGGKRYY